MTNYKYKLIRQGKDARDGLYKGIKIVAKIVGATLGPGGRNVIIEKPKSPPVITNDGVTIARNIILQDELADLGAQAIIDTAVKTNKAVGDGTTTSIVLAGAIIKDVLKKIDGERTLVNSYDNVIEIRESINKSKDIIIQKLKDASKPCVDLETLEKVATVSLQDEKLGKIVAEMVQKIGSDGFIDIEENVRPVVETETVEGMKFYGEYAHYYLANNLAKRQAIWENTPVIITNERIESTEILEELIKIVQKQLKKEKFVLIASNYGKEIVPMIVNTTNRTQFKLLAVKASALTDKQLEDIAIYTGSTFFDARNKEGQIGNATKEDFGYADKIVTNADETIIIGGKGSKEEVEARIKDLKIEKDTVEETPTAQKKLERRISSLSAGVGKIKVGATTDIERVYLRDKIEDAVNASKVALEEGVIKGGGLALKEIADALPEGDILKEAIKVPYEKIQENAGGKLKIGKDILDPVKVTRVAFENACSMAGVFITTEGSICWQRDDLEDKLKDLGFKAN